MTVAGQPDVNYSYDANSRLTDLQSGILNFGFAYDAVGRRTSLSLPNGVTTNYSYDNVSNLLNIESLNPLNQILEKVSYKYNETGNRTRMSRANAPVKVPIVSSKATYNTANQMTTFNGYPLTYDDNGNLLTHTRSCGITNYTWNARNQLIGIDGFDDKCQPLSAFFKYDALGRRIEKTINGKTTNYLYDGLDIMQEIEHGTVTVNYIRTLNIDEPLARIKSDGTIRYYQQDALRSVIALTDETGAIKTRYIYDPFGNVTITGEPSDNPFQYTGRENDNTGLYYYRARYYSPELQRFISEDPIGLAGGINKFLYVNNRPTMGVDPLGLTAPIYPPGLPRPALPGTPGAPDGPDVPGQSCGYEMETVCDQKICNGEDVTNKCVIMSSKTAKRCYCAHWTIKPVYKCGNKTFPGLFPK